MQAGRQGSEKAERPRAQEAGQGPGQGRRQRTRRAHAQVSRRLVCWYSTAALLSRDPNPNPNPTPTFLAISSHHFYISILFLYFIILLYYDFKEGPPRKPPKRMGLFCCVPVPVVGVLLPASSHDCLLSFSDLFVCFGLEWDLKKSRIT
jgi:hypothetical protein